MCLFLIPAKRQPVIFSPENDCTYEYDSLQPIEVSELCCRIILDLKVLIYKNYSYNQMINIMLQKNDLLYTWVCIKGYSAICRFGENYNIGFLDIL